MIEGNHIVYKKSLVWELKKTLNKNPDEQTTRKDSCPTPPLRPTDATKEYQDHECYKKSAKVRTQEPQTLNPPKPLVEF